MGNFSRQQIDIFFLFLPENRIRHFMQIVFYRDNLHELSNPIGKELNKLLCFCSNPIVVFLYVLYM